MNGYRKKIEKYLEKWKCRIRKTQTTYRRNWVGKGWNTHNNQVVFMCQSSSWFHGSGNHSDCFANIAVLLKVVSQKKTHQKYYQIRWTQNLNTIPAHELEIVWFMRWFGNLVIWCYYSWSCSMIRSTKQASKPVSNQ